MVTDLREAGAAAVKVQPRTKAAELPARAVEASAPSQTARETVLRLAEAANSRDRKALLELVGRVMDEEGL